MSILVRGKWYFCLLIGLVSGVLYGQEADRRLELIDATIPEIQAALAAGTVTSRDLVRWYTARIEAYDAKGPCLNTMITLNPKALERAEALDEKRRSREPCGPLHGK